MKLFLINFTPKTKDKISISKEQKEYSSFFLSYILKNFFKKDLILKKESSGKPYFENSSLKISISHSNNTIAFLFSEKNIGVDIEFIKKRNYKKILEHFNIKNDKLTEKEFYQIWTIYEAEYKSNLKKETLSFEYNEKICSLSFEEAKNLEIYEIQAKTKEDFEFNKINIDKIIFLEKPKAAIT